MIVYRVLSKRGDDEEFVETQRISKKSAEADVKIFKDIVRRHAWINEFETKYLSKLDTR